MNKILLASTLAILAAGLFGCATHQSTVMGAPERNAVMAPVHQFADGFNAGDVVRAMAACTDDMCIIDDFPPHAWHGAGAGGKWLHDYEVDAKKNGVTDETVTLHKPRRVDIDGDRAYVVVPVDARYKLHGKPVSEPGAMFTIALQKT